MPEAKITANGKVFTGWTEVTVTRSIEAAAAAFSLGYVDRDPSTGTPTPLKSGDACTVALDGELLVTGYIDSLRSSLTAAARELSVTGRDKTGELVDSSAPTSPGTYRGQTLLALATRLCAPFGVTVRAEAPVGAPFRTFTVQPGETVFEALERASRLRGLLLIPDKSGGLVLTSPGKVPALGALFEGQNLLEASLTHDVSNRFAEYLVMGQSPGDAEFDADPQPAVSATASDAGARKGRKLVILAESALSPSEARTRAQWEATVRAARGLTVTCTVPGWDQGTGKGLWQIGRLVELVAPTLGASGRFLVTKTEFRLSNGEGATTAIELRLPGAYTPRNEVEKSKADRIGLGWEEGFSPAAAIKKRRGNGSGVLP